MIVVIRGDAGEEGIAAVAARLAELGLTYHLSRGEERAVLIVGGGDAATLEAALRPLPAVETILPLTHPYRLAGREVHPESTIVQTDGLLIGTGAPVIVAGPASPVAALDAVETAVALRGTGANAVRTGVYRPTTALYGTPQLDSAALQRLDTMRRAAGLAIAVEVLAAEDVPAVARHADLLIVGGELMHARPLLQACGWSNRPVVLARAESAQVQDWLQAADLVLACGNRQVVLCEAGIRTYEPSIPATLDLSSVPLIRRVSHLPVLVDPSRGATERGTLEPLALAAAAAGAHGLLLQTRSGADTAGAGTLTISGLAALVARLRALTAALAEE